VVAYRGLAVSDLPSVDFPTIQAQVGLPGADPTTMASAVAAPLLPPGLPAPPSFRKANPADQPIMYLALTSATRPLWEIDEYAETLVA
jgi:hydrophobic/amphiphilic exporter-1 (mainly G- bacteria), HAE1 family